MGLFKVKKSNIDKRGLYASKDIKPGTKIIDYIGKLITKKEAGVEPGTSWTLSNKTGKINVTLKWDKVVSTGLLTHDLLHKD